MDTHELAWAAGFFDGEGHTHQQHKLRKKSVDKGPMYSTLSLDIRQVDRQVLDRFQQAVGGAGRIYGPWRNKNPNSRPYYCFSTSKFEDVQATIAMLWKWLGPIKRVQAKTALVDYLSRPRQKAGRKRRLKERN